MARILIVDDSLYMCKLLASILLFAGHEIVGEASNGVDALEKYATLKPDLVTMDITMTEMDGLQAVKAIRTMDEEAVIIMCSAMGQQMMVVEAIQAGAKDFIVKPFRRERVIETVANYTKRGER